MRIRILLLIKATTPRLQTLQSFILILQASTGSVHGPPRLYLEPLKLLNFDFNADQDSFFTLMWIRILLPKIMRIRIRNPAMNSLTQSEEDGSEGLEGAAHGEDGAAEAGAAAGGQQGQQDSQHLHTVHTYIHTNYTSCPVEKRRKLESIGNVDGSGLISSGLLKTRAK
jgi:hypothetical protein